MTDYRTELRPDPRFDTRPGADNRSPQQFADLPPAPDRPVWQPALIVAGVFVVIAILAAVFLTDNRFTGGSILEPAPGAAPDSPAPGTPAPDTVPPPADPAVPPVTSTTPDPAAPAGAAPVVPAPAN